MWTSAGRTMEAAITPVSIHRGVFSAGGLARGREMLGGHWECNIRYIEKNCFGYLLHMYITNKSLLAVVVWNDKHKAMIVSRPLLVNYMVRKYMNQ